MKRITIFILLMFGAVMMVSAQGTGRRFDQRNFPPRVTAEKITVTGNLSIAQGMIAVKSGDITYIVPGIIRYAGFIDGFKEGALVTLEGSAANRRADSNTKFLLASKMTMAGKEYDLSMPRAARQGPGRNEPRHYQHRQGPGYSQPYSHGRRR